MLNYFFVIVLTLSSFSLNAQQSGLNSTTPFFFFQMSDPQFGMYTDNKGFERETVNFEKAISIANQLKPAFIVVTGDLTNQANNTSQINEYKRIVGTLDPSIRLYSAPGNHDVENEPTPESLSYYRSNFGRDYFSFQYGNLYGIVLNSSIFANPTLVSDEAKKQELWLRAELKKARKNKYVNIVVFQHIPWFLNDPDEDDAFYSRDEVKNIPLRTRKMYLGLFKKYDVKYIFSGHLHQNFFGTDGNLEMITTGAVGRPLGDGYPGFRIIKVVNSNLCFPYYGLDSFPKNVKDIWKSENR